VSQPEPYRRIIGDHPQSRSLATALLGGALRERLRSSYTTGWDTT
jgi:hypothetical protein